MKISRRFLPWAALLATAPVTAQEPAKVPEPQPTPAPVAAQPKPPEPPPLPPTHADVPYGTHPRQILDVWLAKGEGPRPLFVHIHGGGWTTGDKALPRARVEFFLNQGISVASVTYRFTPEFPLPAPVHDAARALQFLRAKAGEWHFRKDRVVLAGGSAGACTSMWLLLHDDLADPKSSDPVARESTRVQGAAAGAGQTSIDPKVIEGWLGPNVLRHRMINMAVGELTIDAAIANYAKHETLYHEFSPYNHLDATDPPLYMTYSSDMSLPSKDAGHGIHHPVYGVKMKERSDSLGHECYLNIPGVSKPEKYPTENDFILAILLAP